LRRGQTEGVASIRLTEQDGYLNITLPGLELQRPAEVWLFAYNDSHAVTALTKLMRWNGKTVSMAFPVQSMGASGYAVIAQTDNQTHILAAGKTR